MKEKIVKIRMNYSIARIHRQNSKSQGFHEEDPAEG